MRALLAVPFLVTAASAQDWGDPATVWRLVSIDGAAPAEETTLSFPAEERLAGKAACNSFTGRIAGPPEEFRVGIMAVTRMACPGLAFETAFLETLQAMTTGTQAGRLMFLTDGESRFLVFQSD